MVSRFGVIESKLRIYAEKITSVSDQSVLSCGVYLRSVAFKATRSIQESISTLYFGVVLLLQGWDNSLSQGYPSELNPPARVAQQQQQQ